MDELLEVFRIEDALHEFRYLNLYNASLVLLHAMNYPIQEHSGIVNQRIEDFIYFTVQNKVHYSAQEMVYLKKIDAATFLAEFQHSDLLNTNKSSDDTIVFLAIEITSSDKERSEDTLYISQILNKTYDGFVVLIVKNADSIMFCTYIDNYTTYMSEWYNINSTYVELFPLLAVCYSYISGVKTIRDFYYEFAYGISRDYIVYSESYEFIAYQVQPYIDLDVEDTVILRQQIKDVAEQNYNYYKEIYGYDYVDPDNGFKVLVEEDDEWTLLELDDFIITDEEVDEADDYYYDENNYVEQLDYSDIDKETLNDPVKLLKWIEQRG